MGDVDLKGGDPKDPENIHDLTGFVSFIAFS